MDTGLSPNFPDGAVEQHVAAGDHRPDFSRLNSFEFATNSLPPDRRFGAWRENFAPMLELAEGQAKQNGFNGKQTVWDLGCLAFSRIHTDAIEFSNVTARSGCDPLDHFILTVLLSGSANTISPARTFRCNAGVAQVHSLGRSFHGSLTNCEMLMLFVPRDFSLEVTRALSAAEFSTLDTSMGRLFHDFLLGVDKRLPSVRRTDLPALATAIRAMILACATPSVDPVDAAGEPIATALLERAQRLVHARLFHPKLDANTLRRELGVSRSRLYRLFEPFGGVKHYIQHRRLLDAHTALANPNDTRRILDIAEQHCFVDGTEFSRAFRREFGYCPTEVRKGKKCYFPCSSPAELPSCRPEERLGVMLRQLHG